MTVIEERLGRLSTSPLNTIISICYGAAMAGQNGVAWERVQGSGGQGSQPAGRHRV